MTNNNQTKAELLAKFKATKELLAILDEYAKLRHSIDVKFPMSWALDEVWDDGLCLRYREYSNYGDYEEKTIFVSVEELFDPNITKLRNQAEARARQDERRRQEELARATKMHEDMERAELARLRAKYETEGSK